MIQISKDYGKHKIIVCLVESGKEIYNLPLELPDDVHGVTITDYMDHLFSEGVLSGFNVINKDESIYVLGSQRDCWVMEYNWTSSSMKRWFDKASGLLLKIHVVLFRQGINIVVTETAVKTNIDLN